MHNRTLIKNAILVNEGGSQLGSIVIEDDRIEEILIGRDVTPVLPTDSTIDAEGCYLLPGVIDEHVHFRDPGLTHKADFDSESRAAAAGGVTTVLDMPNTIPATVTAEALQEKIERAKNLCHVNFGFFVGATADNAHRLRQINPSTVAGVKLFMGSSTGSLQVEDPDALLTVFEESQLPIMVHCEDTPMITAAMKEHQARYGVDPHGAITRPSVRPKPASRAHNKPSHWPKPPKPAYTSLTFPRPANWIFSVRTIRSSQPKLVFPICSLPMPTTNDSAPASSVTLRSKQRQIATPCAQHLPTDAFAASVLTMHRTRSPTKKAEPHELPAECRWSNSRSSPCSTSSTKAY